MLIVGTILVTYGSESEKSPEDGTEENTAEEKSSEIALDDALEAGKQAAI